MRSIVLIGCVLIGTSLAGCKDGTIPMLGLNGKGKVVRAFATPARFQSKFEQTMVSVHRSVVPTLNRRSADQEKQWQLQLISVGLGLNAGIGFGPFKIGITPGLRVFFTNVPTPPPLP